MTNSIKLIHPIILEDIKDIAEENIFWNKLKNKTLLVSGASGIIGSYMVYTILYLNERINLNCKVLALVRNELKAKQQFKIFTENNNFKLIIQDVCNYLKYNEDIDYIIHAASQASPKYFVSDPVGTIKSNTLGTINLLDLAIEKNTSGFLYLSSREIYGNVSSCDFISENDYGIIDHISTRSCYTESKRMSETICSSYNYQYKINCKISRFAHTYGPDYVLNNGRVWGDFINSIVKKQDIILRSLNNTELSFTYVSDTVKGLFMVLLNGEELIYNISNNKEIIGVTDLANLLAVYYKKYNINVKFDVKENLGYLNTKIKPLDCSKISSLGWSPKIKILDGFSRAIQYHETLF